MTRKRPKNEPTPHDGPTHSPEQVAEAFTTIRDNLDLIEVAYQEAIEAAVPPNQFQCWDAMVAGD